LKIFLFVSGAERTANYLVPQVAELLMQFKVQVLLSPHQFSILTETLIAFEMLTVEMKNVLLRSGG
jgi:hypothetical protein